MGQIENWALFIKVVVGRLCIGFSINGTNLKLGMVYYGGCWHMHLIKWDQLKIWHGLLRGVVGTCISINGTN